MQNPQKITYLFSSYTVRFEVRFGFRRFGRFEVQFSGGNWRFGRFTVRFWEVWKVQGSVFLGSTQH